MTCPGFKRKTSDKKLATITLGLPAVLAFLKFCVGNQCNSATMPIREDAAESTHVSAEVRV
jgi:hypothetical protein